MKQEEDDEEEEEEEVQETEQPPMGNQPVTPLPKTPVQNNDSMFETPSAPGAPPYFTDIDRMPSAPALGDATASVDAAQHTVIPRATTGPATIDENALKVMTTLAQLSHASKAALSPHPTVTPSQVTLPPAFGDVGGSADHGDLLRRSEHDKGLESFARIEFADSVFQMTTYAVIIGRDQRAMKLSRRNEIRAAEHNLLVQQNQLKGLPPPSPLAQDYHKFSKSYVSEEGGMLGPESDSGESGRPVKRHKPSATRSPGLQGDESQDNTISDLQYVSHTPGAAAVDLTSLQPSRAYVPIIGIHSPGPDFASKTKTISRHHLKIAYNEKHGYFEATPLHKNGFFCEEKHHSEKSIILRCGDRLQIKDISFRFIINGVERGSTGAFDESSERLLRRSHGGKEMSFDFENSYNADLRETSDDELSEVESLPDLSDFGGEDAGLPDQAAAAASAVSDVAQSEEAPSTQLDQPMLQLPRKRGPGRPPKNGFMSKREQRLLKKQQQEMAKAALPQEPPAEPPVKRKVGRPRKHPLPQDGSGPPEKRKYKPRKPKEDGAEGSEAERRAKEKKDKKVRPKSPPLALKMEDYNEEQLQKPNKNYGVLIDETLTAAGPDGLTLKQIYKRICQSYPWFYFHTETKGWESSVRHNLIGNVAFKKDDITGLWSRVPGVELDAGKKRKASSPDRSLAASQGYAPYAYPYNGQHQSPPGTHGFPTGPPAPGYQAPAFHPQHGQPAQPPHQFANSTSRAGQHVVPMASQPPAPAHLPGYGLQPAPARTQPASVPLKAYSSAYTPRLPVQGNPLIKTENGGVMPGIGAASQRPLAAAEGGTKTVPDPGAFSQQQQQPPKQQPQALPKSHFSAQTTAARPSAQAPAGAPGSYVIHPQLLKAITGLKNGLINSLKTARTPQAEAIVMSALNRSLGLKKDTTDNEKMEAICIKGIRQVVDGFSRSSKSPTPGGTVNPDVMPPMLEARVVASLNGFRDVSVKALKGRLGEARAEAVALSAIDRVFLLADASIAPPPAEGDTIGNLEGVEQHLMNSIRQLFDGMKLRLPVMPEE